MLTPVGERVVEQAQRVLRDVHQLVDIAQSFKDPLGGELRLGIIPTVAPYLLPRILGPVQRQFPALRLQLIEAQTHVIARMLREGELDAVVLALPLDEEHIEQRLIYSEPFYLAVSKLHPKAGAESVRLGDLEQQAVLLLEDGHCLRDQALAICNTAHATENVNVRATSLETLRQMVAANAGVTLMPALAVTADAGPVRYLPFSEPDPHRDIGLCWRTSSTRDALLRELSDLLASTLRGVFAR
jgi:LysR family hydrogen peroxide-inducible transcriptional activator